MSPIRMRLRELREKAELSQQALAELAGVRQATISELESGSAQGIKFETLERLSEALDADPGALFERDKKRRSK